MTWVRLERRGRVATLMLDRPEKLNAINAEMYAQINQSLREIDRDDDIWAAVVCGGDRAFCAGADLGEHADEAGSASWPEIRSDEYDHGLVVNKPLIAAISGHCLGAGLELALFCDIRVASDDAQFGTPEVRWGLLHNYGAHRLPNLIGRGSALQMLLTGDPIDAATAYRIGLIQEKVATGAALARAFELAERICQNAPLSVRATKELALASEEVNLLDGVRHAAAMATVLDGSHDACEGTAAFVQKRSPRFQGR